MSALPQVTVLPGDCRERMRAMATASVHCCVTSPPYWGLRDYGLPPLVWGGKQECAHEWHTNKYCIEKTASPGAAGAFTQAGPANAERLEAGRWRIDNTCMHCGAWKGSLGLEPTPARAVARGILMTKKKRRAG